ncbi:MAG: 3'-5' exonuclease [Myxococcales bacterium]|jgi:DNA polymerase-3 subunit epsilon
MRGGSIQDVCGCFPTGRHYPGIAERIARSAGAVKGLARHIEPEAEWVASKLAVIDFETTGLSPENDRVIEIGVVCFEGGELSGLKNWLVNPGIPVPEESRAVHNISDEELAGAPTFREVLPELTEMLSGCLPVAYNAVFDRGFLHAELARAGADRGESAPPAYQAEVTWVDPLVWSRELDKDQRSHKLGNVCARLGVTLDNAHRAASDAEATGRVLLAFAPRMPATYAELIRIQAQYAATQEVDLSWRRRP